MKRIATAIMIVLLVGSLSAQNRMTPELLWNLGRVSPLGISLDGQSVVYRVTSYHKDSNELTTKDYMIPVAGGSAVQIENGDNEVKDKLRSPSGAHRISIRDVKIQKVFGKDYYPELDYSEVMVYDDLMYRHWDTWEDGKFSHIFLHNSNEVRGIDIMEGEAFNCPTTPFGGSEDCTWSPDGKTLVYVAKKKSGKAYALSTNSDLYAYDVASGETRNLTVGMLGYETHPVFSSSGALAWLSMERDGYESDKNDIVVMDGTTKVNLTKDWDGTVSSFLWNRDNSGIYFNAPVDGTIQLFELDYPGKTKKKPVVKQITEGDFDITGMVGLVDDKVIVSRTDMNHAAEIYAVNLSDGSMEQITHVNDDQYSAIKMSVIEKRYVKTTDKKDMLVWVIYPPDFDPSKKYPTLLYCQGGPQSPLSQFYSFRWNFQLMAANGYIIVAPNRRGMPGHGVAWNEAISKDFGGQPMRDYLSAIDELAKEKYVDKDRLGAVGASYGGYSIFYLAGIHEKRFKSFISHDGIFNMKSMYGGTEEVFFVNWENGGAYWELDNKAAMKTYNEFDPSNLVNSWDTPIMIIQGGKDYRVPDGQAFEAFQAAQLKGIKSRLLYFPDENHWVLNVQNGLVWQREFFRWLRETL